MGIDDREYMRADPEPAFMRPQRRRAVVPMLVGCGVAAVVSVVAYRGGLDRLLMRFNTAQQSTSADHSRPSSRNPVPTGQPPSSVEQSEQRRPSASTSTVYKCVRDGKAMYSDASDGGCGVARQVVSVRTDVNILQPVFPPKQEPATSQSSTRTVVRTVPSGSNECQALDKLIESIDAAARQPQSPVAQDQLRQRRHAARDRQIVLRC